jgi:RNA polymerase sigma factor (sigma-70 family)
LRANVESMDIVQDAMLVAAHKIDDVDLRSSGAILNWLARIAENKIHDAHDYFTAHKRDRGRETPLGIEIGGESVGWDPPDRAPSPSQAAASSEVAEIVDDVLTELSVEHREVILLKHYCGAEWEDIARALDRGVPAAQELLRRAWANLREKARPRLQGWS